MGPQLPFGTFLGPNEGLQIDLSFEQRSIFLQLKGSVINLFEVSSALK